VVAAAVGEQLPQAAARPPAPAADRWHGFDQWDQLGDVVAVAAGQRDGQWHAAGVDDQVVLAARAAPVGTSAGSSIPARWPWPYHDARRGG
jgi:hypothetical protein